MARTKALPEVGFTPIDASYEALAKNDLPAIASLLALYAQRVNAIGYAGRTVANWWGYPPISISGGNFSPPAKDVALRFPWFHSHVPGTFLRGSALVLPTKYEAPYNQGLKVGIDAVEETYVYGASSLASLGTDAAPNPSGLEPVDFLGDIDDSTPRVAEVIVGQGISGATYAHKAPDSGCLYEAAQKIVDPTVAGAYVPTDWLAPDRAIAAASANDLGNLNRLRLMLLHHWAWMRPAWCWSILNPADADTAGNYIEFSESPEEFRYIFDQRVGDGGTAPAVDGPGITFPLYKAASGRNVNIRLACYVYAAMSGGTDTGAIGLSARNAGAMSAIVVAPTNPITVSGTTFRWYSLLADPPALWNVKATDKYNRLVLCAKSSGATDVVRVAGFAFVPVPASNIP